MFRPDECATIKRPPDDGVPSGSPTKEAASNTLKGLAVSGELHSDEEALLLEDGSRQPDLWGINLYPADAAAEWIEFDAMINVRPSQGNRSRDVEDEATRDAIRRIVNTLVVGP